MSTPASKARLMREMMLLNKDPPPGVAAYTPQPNDMTKIRAQITGPEGSPFEGGIFLLVVNITGRYPFEPPRCRFLTKLYHPNIDNGGRICLDTLKSPPAGSWSPAVSLPSLLLSIRSLMAEPNPDDGLVPEISELYKRNPNEWRKEARRRTQVEASAEQLRIVEASLDGENDDQKMGTTGSSTANMQVAAASSNSTDSKVEASRTSNQAENVGNVERPAKKSKLCSRK